MKKFFSAYLFVAAILCAFVSSCSEEETFVHPMSGTYALSSYETVAEPKANYPVSSPIYSDIVIPKDLFIQNLNGVLRMMGEVLLPQVLNTITLDNDGNVCASYIENPTVKSDKLSNWAMGVLMLGQGFPAANEVSANKATGGFVDSKKGLASWTEQNGVLTLKLNISNIIKEALKEGNIEDMTNLINMVLTMEPAKLKEIMSGIGGEDLMRINDATITQLQSWALNGIPMKVIKNGASVDICLQKKDFDSLFTQRDSGKKDTWGNPVYECDAALVFTLLKNLEILPKEAEMAGGMIAILQQNWTKIENFDLGLSLVKKN